MSSPEITSRLGLVDLPALVEPLTAAGFQLSGGGPFREAAAEIKAAAEQGVVSAIFVADVPQPGIKAWLTRMATHGATVVILRGDVPRLEIDGARSVDLPCTVAELLAAAELFATTAAAAGVRIDVDGAVTQAASQPSALAPAGTIPEDAASAVAVEAPAKSAGAKTAAAKTSRNTAPAPASDVAPVDDFESAPIEPAPSPPAVQASPILFAGRRAAQADAGEDPAPVAPVAPLAPLALSPWDEDVTANPAVTAALSIPAPTPAVEPVPAAAGALSPWDYPAVAVTAPEPDIEPYVAREEDWFGQPAVQDPPRTPQPAARATEPKPQVPVAQVPHGGSTFVPATQDDDAAIDARFGDRQSISEDAYGLYGQPAPAYQPAAPHQDHPWGQPQPHYQHQGAPVAVLTEPQAPVTPHVQEPFFTSPEYVPAPEPIYQSTTAAAPAAYESAPAYADPQDAVDAMFAAAAPREQMLQAAPAPRRIRGHGSPLAVVCAEKGGVGKTNTTLALAQRAADRAPGRKIVLVDMNRGQGDIRKYLKLGGAQVPSILDAAISGNLAEAVLSPEQVTAARHSSLPPISFGVVLAPEPEAADPRIVTPEVYQRVIDLVRDQADLVVVDTQIIEIHDTSGLVDGLIIPALAHDAFGVTLTDTSAPGVSNLVSMLKFFAQQGVPANRLMIMINRALAGYDTNVLRGMLTHHGAFVGAVEEKSLLARQANMGRIPHNDPSMAPVLDAVLLRVTGWPCFQPAAPAQTKKKLFGFGRKGKS